MVLIFLPNLQMGASEVVDVTIDGSASIEITMQYESIMIGSDKDNRKWDIL